MTDVTVRPATPEDHDAVTAFTQDTWSERDVDDYIPDVYPEWVAGDGDDQRTLLAGVDGSAAGICQAVLLSEYEGWLQGMRVNPEFRGRGVGLALVDELLSWCREGGASVARNMVFSWNDGGLGQSRAAGFDPGIEGRWAHPEPDPEADIDPALTLVEDPDAAWGCWMRSDARDVLGGLGLHPEEAWALWEVGHERLHALADDRRVLAVQDERGTQAMAARVRVDERETETGVEEHAIYGPSAWADLDAARALFDAIAADAAAIGADATRVLIPETPRHVSDVAAARADASDEPIFVLEADLTGERW